MRKLYDVLDPTKRKIIDRIKNELERLFEPRPTSDPFTPHNLSHAEQVEEYLDLIIPDDKKDALSDNLVYWLLASAYLHDIGMSIHKDVMTLSDNQAIMSMIADSNRWERDFPRNLPLNLISTIRNNHAELSSRYIRDKGDSLGITDGFSRYVISIICHLHTQKWAQISEYTSMKTLEKTNRVLTLSALLRLADILHSDYSRIEFERLHIELLPNLPITSWMHWAKHLMLQKVLPSPAEGAINLLFARPSGIDDDIYLNDIIRNICQSIKDEIDRTRNILHRSGIAPYIAVTNNTVENSDEHGPLSPGEEKRIKFFLKQYQISRQISAAGVEDSLLLSIEDIVVSQNWNTQRFDEQVLEPVEHLLGYAADSYHGNQKIKTISDKTIGLLVEEKNKLNSSKYNKAKVKAAIKGMVTDERKLNERIKKDIMKHSKVLFDELDFEEGNECILLYSYSTAVAQGLKSIKQKVSGKKSKLLVAECRNKCISPFSDAIAYVNTLCGLGIRIDDTRFISDASIAYYMHENKSGYSISKVFLGAGDGWIDQTGKKFWILNSVGSRIITSIAKLHKIEVFVFAKTSFFSVNHPPERSKVDPNIIIGDNDPNLEKLLKNMNERTFNRVYLDPVQDRIPSDEIDYLITDMGSFKKDEFVNFINRLRARDDK